MQLFFTIVAGIVVGFLLVLAILYLFLRVWLRRTIKRFADLASEATKGIAPFMQPLRIMLQRERDPGWTDKTAVDRLVRPLIGAGFQDAGVYTIEEFPDIRFQALAQPDKSVYAAVYEHPDNGVWIDVVSRYEDGTALTSTTAKAAGIDHPPHKPTERFDPDTDPLHLYQQHLARRPDKALAPASCERFVADFQRAYAEGMDWRFERGGTTEEEIRNVLKHLGKEATDQQVKQVHAMQQAQVGQWLQVKLQENFRAQCNLADAKWRQMEHRMIFVDDRMTADEAYGLFMNFLDWEDEDAAEECSERAEELAHGPAREAFRRMLQTLPADRAVKKVGHVTEPVASDVYLGPDSMDGEVE